MNILLLNLIVNTPDNGLIPCRETNHDSMIYNMARGFVSNGHTVTIIASKEYRPHQPENNSFDVIYLPSRLPFIFKPALLPFPGGLYRHLKKNKDKYDLVISSETFSIASLIATIALPGKVMIWQELPTHQRLLFKLPSKIWHNLAGRVIMRNTPVVGRSLPARNFIRQYLKYVSDKIVDHGANSEIFSPNPENTHQKRFIVISQLIKRKRIDYIISQFAKFAAVPEYSNYTLDIVGKGPQKEELQKLILSLGMTEKINLRGFLTHKELTPLSASSTGLLVYTDQDLNMVTIPESIVNGTPVLTNTVPCTASFIDSNQLGIVKDNWGPDELAQMAENYSALHINCLNIRHMLTEKGCAARLVEIWTTEFSK